MSDLPSQVAFLQKALRFGMSGVLVTAIHVVVAVALIELGSLMPPVANGIAFTVATISSYLINTTWSFSSPLHGRNLLRFLVVSGVGLLLSVTLSGLVQQYQLPYWYGIAAVVVIVPPTTFLLHNFWTYQ